MSKERKVGLGLLAIALLAGLIIFGIALAHESGSLYYTVIFDDAKGLQQGDRVQLSGVDVGVVKWVQLHTQPTRVDVRVKIPAQHAGKIRADSTAIIRSVSFPNVSGQKIIEVIDPQSTPPAPPMAGDTVVYGLNSELELAAWRLKQKFKGGTDDVGRMLDTMGDRMTRMRDEVKEIATSPKVQEAMQHLRDFLLKMKEKGREVADQLEQEWPKLRQELEPVLKELQDFNREYIAQQLKQIMDQIEKTLKQWRETAPEKAPEASPTPAA